MYLCASSGERHPKFPGLVVCGCVGYMHSAASFLASPKFRNDLREEFNPAEKSGCICSHEIHGTPVPDRVGVCHRGHPRRSDRRGDERRRNNLACRGFWRGGGGMSTRSTIRSPDHPEKLARLLGVIPYAAPAPKEAGERKSRRR